MSDRMSDRWLGLDIGGTKLLGAVVSGDGREILAWERMASRRDDGPDAVFDRTVELGRKLAVHAGGVTGVGIGFAGLVDHRSGIVDSSVILPGWNGFPLAERATSAFTVPCIVDNDATAAGFGEFVALGSPPGLNMVLLTVGTGIGGAILIDGKLYRGRTNTSAEFGNTTIDWQGQECVSGNHGSLNTLASGTALCRRAGALAQQAKAGCLLHNGEPITGERVAEAAERGDPVALAAIEEVARALGTGIANFINIFNPDRVVLAGGLCNLGPGYLETVCSEARARAFPITAAHARITFSSHGDLASVYGAACLVAEAAR